MKLFQPVDNASLVFFRIFFGLIMAVDLIWHLGAGVVEHVWALPNFHFKYYGFEWVQTWPGDGMYWHFVALALLALCVGAGFYYRFSAILLFFGFTYTFLAEKAAYQNHFYLLCLISFFMILLPVDRTFSLDTWRGRITRATTVPAWNLWLLRGQISLVYFYGGVAKLNDDWLRGEPMRLWLKGYGDYWLIGPFVQEEWLVGLFTFGGLLLDLVIAPLLLWPRARPYGVILALSFHLINHWIFRIGIFPWFMIGSIALFFEPDWPRRLLARLRGETYAPENSPPVETPLNTWQKTTLFLLTGFTAIQVLAPLRHHLYPGDTSWTEQGHRFAWRMMLRDKKVQTTLTMRAPGKGVHWEVNLNRHLAPWQQKVFANDPDMILQFCRYLKQEQEAQGFEDYEVYARVLVSLNGRPMQLLVDPQVDLASQARTLWPAPWINPLTTPLPDPGKPQ